MCTASYNSAFGERVNLDVRHEFIYMCVHVCVHAHIGNIYKYIDKTYIHIYLENIYIL